MVGSRCGPIDKALELLALTDDYAGNDVATQPLHVEKYITRVFPLCAADQAIEWDREKSTMKVQVQCSER